MQIKAVTLTKKIAKLSHLIGAEKWRLEGGRGGELILTWFGLPEQRGGLAELPQTFSDYTALNAYLNDKLKLFGGSNC